jgi:hypothetical protein
VPYRSHLIWCPKYRRKVLVDEVAAAITQHLDLDAARLELFGVADLASTMWEQDGVPASIPLTRQDFGVRPEETLSGEEKQRVQYRRPPGRRSLVRIRRRHEAKSRVASDRAARLATGLPVANQSSPTAKAA